MTKFITMTRTHPENGTIQTVKFPGYEADVPEGWKIENVEHQTASDQFDSINIFAERVGQHIQEAATAALDEETIRMIQDALLKASGIPADLFGLSNQKEHDPMAQPTNKAVFANSTRYITNPAGTTIKQPNYQRVENLAHSIAEYAKELQLAEEIRREHAQFISTNPNAVEEASKEIVESAEIIVKAFREYFETEKEKDIVEIGNVKVAKYAMPEEESVTDEAICNLTIGNLKKIEIPNEEEILGTIENINYPEVMNCLVTLVNYSERLHKAQIEGSDVDDETKIAHCAEMDLHLASLRESFGLEDKRVGGVKHQREIGYVNFIDVSDKLHLLMKRASQLQRSTEVFGELFGPTQYEVIDVFAHMRGDILEVQRELDLSLVPESATDEGSEEDNDIVYYLGKNDTHEQIHIMGVTGNMDINFTHQHFIYDVFEPRQFDSYADAQVWLNEHIKKKFIAPEDRLLDQDYYFKK